MRQWAWRLLPHHIDRLCLFLVYARPRGHAERIAWAKYLRQIRKKSKLRPATELLQNYSIRSGD